MKKRIVSLVLVVAMLLCVLPAASAAEGDPVLKSYYLSLSDSIAINFKVSNWVDGTVVTVNEKAAEPKSVSNDGVALFSHTDLSPDMISETISISINGSEPKKLSVLGYCEAILADNYSGTMKRLAADLVNYGIAFHAYKNSTAAAIDAPANTAAYATVNTPALSDEIDNTIVGMTAAGASLKDSVELYFDCAAAEKLVITKAGGTAQEVTREENEDYFYFKLYATEMRKVVTVKAYAAGDVELEGELKTSIEDYAAYCNSEGATNACKAAADVTVAMMKYGDSAAAYVANPNGAVDKLLYSADLSGAVNTFTGAGKLGDWTASNTEDGLKIVTTDATGTVDDKAYNAQKAHTYTVNLADSKKITVEWDMMVNTTSTTFLPTLGFTGDTATILNFGVKNGKFVVSDGKADATPAIQYNVDTGIACANNTKYNIKILIDFDRDIYNVFINGNLVRVGYNLRVNTASYLKSVGVDIKENNGAESTVWYDNLLIKTSTLDTVLYQNNESSTTFSKTFAGSPAGEVVFEYTVQSTLPDDATSQSKIFIRGTGNKTGGATYSGTAINVGFWKGKIVFNGGTISGIDEQIAYKIDPETKVTDSYTIKIVAKKTGFDFYVNGELIVENHAFANGVASIDNYTSIGSGNDGGASAQYTNATVSLGALCN